MTLEELTALVTTNALKAHVILDTGITKSRIRSVSIRIDDDGVASVVLHAEHMRERVTSEEVREKNAIIEAVKALRKKHPDLADNLSNISNMYVSQTELWEFLASHGVPVDDDDTIWESMERFFGTADEK
jgi:hypothetical protein